MCLQDMSTINNISMEWGLKRQSNHDCPPRSKINSFPLYTRKVDS